MRSFYRNALVMVLGAGMIGCEWQGGSGGNDASQSTGAANFSGTYTAAGGFVVSLSSASSSTSTVNTVEQIGTGTGPAGKHFQGTLSHTPVAAGSVNVSWGGGSVADSNGKLTGSLTSSGTINYNTGFIDITTDPAPAAGAPVNVSYSFLSTSAAGDNSGITSFNVQQEGQQITIIDNNGKSYSGTMGASRTGSGAALAAAAAGDEVTSEFSASGVNASGTHVNLVGTFQATVSGAAPSIILTNRKITGTWIEDGGHTAGINGTAN